MSRNRQTIRGQGLHHASGCFFCLPLKKHDTGSKNQAFWVPLSPLISPALWGKVLNLKVTLKHDHIFRTFSSNTSFLFPKKGLGQPSLSHRSNVMSAPVSVTSLYITLLHCSCLCSNVSVTLQSAHRQTRGLGNSSPPEGERLKGRGENRMPPYPFSCFR